MIKSVNKSEWKKFVKKSITNLIIKTLKDRQKSMTKLRFIETDSFKQSKYITELESKKCRHIIRIKLNMIRAKCNYKGSNKNLICDWCQVEETTQHYIQCKKRRQITVI